MSIRFNADEVLAMAEQIETDGALFYRRAAKMHSGKIRVSFLNLASMEDDHKATFSSMRKKLSGKLKEGTASDPYLEAELYLQSIASSHGGEGAKTVADVLTGRESVEEILRTAIGLEEKSVVFYLGLREMVPVKLGRDLVDGIIAEEKSHIVTLAAELKKINRS